MDPWLKFCHLVVDHEDALGVPLLVAVIFTLILPALIAETKHARAQPEKVPAFPWNPGQHLRLYAYIFDGDAWRAGGLYERSLILLLRTALMVAYLGCGLLFIANVSLM